jgi:hypothetical protein
MKLPDMGDQGCLEEAVIILNKIGCRKFGKSFGEMEIPELLVAADAANITTNNRMDSTREKSIIAMGGVNLAFQEPTEIEPRLMNNVW